MPLVSPSCCLLAIHFVNCKKASATFSFASLLRLEETELKVAEHTKEHDRVKRARLRKLEVLRRPRISAQCSMGMNRNE
jgi:hypothetical protein